MARLNLTIPDDLKNRMNEHSDHDVNWSAVAAQAFEIKLGEIIARKGAKDMEDVIARLRGSKATFSDREYKSAYEVGQQWAKQWATFDQLTNLSRHSQGLNLGDDDDFESNNAYGASGVLYFRMNPGEDGCRDLAEEFWKTQLDNEYPPAPALRGFVNGALDLWDQIENQI